MRSLPSTSRSSEPPGLWRPRARQAQRVPDTSVRPETEAPKSTIVQVLLFAHYRDLAGVRECDVELAGGGTVGDLVALLRSDPRFQSLPPEPLVAVNRDYADYGRRLAAGDEVALIPPVSGG